MRTKVTWRQRGGRGGIHIYTGIASDEGKGSLYVKRSDEATAQCQNFTNGIIPSTNINSNIFCIPDILLVIKIKIGIMHSSTFEMPTFL